MFVLRGVGTAASLGGQHMHTPHLRVELLLGSHLRVRYSASLVQNNVLARSTEFDAVSRSTAEHADDGVLCVVLVRAGLSSRLQLRVFDQSLIHKTRFVLGHEHGRVVYATVLMAVVA